MLVGVGKGDSILYQICSKHYGKEDALSLNEANFLGVSVKFLYTDGQNLSAY